jgi:hypothetical protein
VDHLVGERPRHERQDVRVVVAEVVAPPERVVDASAIEARDVALEVAEGSAEQIDLRLILQQSCPVRTPLAGMPAALKLNASVPTGEMNWWFLPIASK